MAARKAVLPLAPIEEIARKAGVQRLSESATIFLRDSVIEFAERLAASIVEITKHAGRTTVKKEDIEIAAKR